MHAVCLLFQNSSMLAKLDYTLTYIPNHIPIRISLVLYQNFLMMLSLNLFLIILCLLLCPGFLLSFHCLIQPCIIKSILSIPILLSFDPIIGVMVFVEPLFFCCYAKTYNWHGELIVIRVWRSDCQLFGILIEIRLWYMVDGYLCRLVSVFQWYLDPHFLWYFA